MTMRLSPTTTPDTAEFWNALREHRLLIQRCAGCDTLRHPPRPMCPACGSVEHDAVEASGRGTVFSFVLPRHPVYPGLDNPEIVAIVELAEGTRIVTNLVDVDADAVRIGMTVVVRFTEFDGGLVLPLFAPEDSP